jgi:hypothetical protein
LVSSIPTTITLFRRILPPGGVPEEEYSIILASDQFKEVEGRKLKFQKLFPILQDVVKYSGVDGVPALHEGPLLERHRQPVNNHIAVDAAAAVVNNDTTSAQGGVMGVMDTLGPREAVVTPVNPSRVNTAGSVMGSHLVRPMGSRQAKAAAAAAARKVTRYGTPVAGTSVAAVQEPEEVVVVPPPPPPPRSEAADIADNLTMFLGTIFCDGHKKDQFDVRYDKCWKALIHHQDEEVKAEKVMEEMLTYMEPLQQQHQELLEEEDEVQVVAATEDSDAPATGAIEDQSVNLLDSGGQEEEGEEQDFTGDKEQEDDDGSETLVPPPPKPVLAQIFLSTQTSLHSISPSGATEATPEQEPQQVLGKTG